MQLKKRLLVVVIVVVVVVVVVINVVSGTTVSITLTFSICRNYLSKVMTF